MVAVRVQGTPEQVHGRLRAAMEACGWSVQASPAGVYLAVAGNQARALWGALGGATQPVLIRVTVTPDESGGAAVDAVPVRSHAPLRDAVARSRRFDPELARLREALVAGG